MEHEFSNPALNVVSVGEDHKCLHNAVMLLDLFLCRKLPHMHKTTRQKVFFGTIAKISINIRVFSP